MRGGQTIVAIVPALNEERSIGKVLDAIPSWVDDIVVVDNGSTDRTQEVASKHGARVVRESRRGYGSACLAGMSRLGKPDVVVFLDGDFSDHPEEMDRLVDPIVVDETDMVIGSRVRGESAPGALTLQARFGNWLACRLMKLFWGAEYTDLGPFRAIRYKTLLALNMRDPDYGWTVEMQIKAARDGVRTLEIPVSYRKRIGKSKVSGTIRGVVGAGTKILATIFVSALGYRQPIPGLKLIVFTKFPTPGETKTRLIPTLSPEEACEVHTQLAKHTMDLANQFSEVSGVALEVRYAGGSRSGMRNWLGEEHVYRSQGRGDLGRRMRRAFDAAFRAGWRSVAIIGTDCPEITTDLLEGVFGELDRSDLVLGPAKDGGYYLIGLRRPRPGKSVPNLFDGIRWGTGEVLERTLDRATREGLTVTQFRTLSDVDRPEDLSLCEDLLSQ